MKILGQNAKVNTLIDDHSRVWNKLLVNQIFKPEEAKIICEIPISRYGVDDKMIWRLSQNGVSSIKNAYFLAVSRRRSSKGESSNTDMEATSWKAIWKLNVPINVKHFI